MVEKASGPQIRLMVLASSSEALIGVRSQGWWEMMPEWDARVVMLLPPPPRRGDAAAAAAWVAAA